MEKLSTRRPTPLGALLALLLASACGDDETRAPAQPSDFLDELPIVVAEDLDDDPHVLEVELVARVVELEVLPGIMTPVWTYGGTLPGPLLRLAAGDTLRVHFKNELPEATTIHWHGVRVPNAMDGMPGHSQDPIQPGESFDYEFIVPDPGTFWYHPHLDDSAQLTRGLYGAIVVDPAAGSEPTDLGDEVVLVLSDMSIDEDGALVPPDQGGELATLFGREGSTVLVNGRVNPHLRARNGLRQRWRLINAARSRYFLLGLEGQSLTRIGGQAGLSSEAQSSDRLLLVPGERAEVVVEPRGVDGGQLELVWTPFDRGYGSTEYRDPVTVATIDLEGAPLPSLGPVPALAQAIAPLDVGGSTPVEIHLTEEVDEEGHIHLGMNGESYPESVPIPAEVGRTQVWTVTNDTDWDHPFHLHGFFFQTLDDDLRPIEPIEWRDTANVPKKSGTLRFAVAYDNRPGMWMFHCHILDHADAGMMGMIDLQ